jgi:hypothetical protein
MSFQTIFDIHDAGVRVAFLAPAFACLFVLSLMGWWRVRRGRMQLLPPPRERVSSGLQAAFFAVLTFLAFVATWGAHWSLISRMDNGRVERVQGAVHDFKPAETYKGTEQFSVASQTFSYSRVSVQQGFHTMSGDGGPVRNGLCVRILYQRNDILRIESAGDSQNCS